METKNEKERTELHKMIWAIAEDLRGTVDGWDFKAYVLGMLFYRFISENLANYINKDEQRIHPDFKYEKLDDKVAEKDKKGILEDKGFFIYPSELFCNIRANAKNDKDLNVTIHTVFSNIESSAKGTDSEDDLEGLFSDFDVNSNKLGKTVEERNEKILNLINKIGDLPLGDYKDNSIDLFGDAYEFLMTMYASSAGKSGGEFFTPQEVGDLLARIVIGDKKEINKVYDPCCGSGGLLLKFAKVLGKENVKDGYFGQENNLTTYNLSRINMFLHDINYNKFNIGYGDTILNPVHWDEEPFDAIVSNPPYSHKWVGKDNPLLINDPRFAPAGVLAPKKFEDLQFTMHMLSWLSPKGTAAIVEFPGVLYRGSAEQKIRKYLIDNNFIEAVIQLPGEMFFGTPIATCIIVLKKNKIDNNILFLDVSDKKTINKDRMKNATNKYKLSDENIKDIIEFLNRRTTIEKRSLLASYDLVKENKYNISVSTYVKNLEEPPEINIKELNNEIKEIVRRELKTREELDKIVSELEADYE